MVYNILRYFGKNQYAIRNGMLYTYRMCSNDVNTSQHAGQSSKQNETATYGAPEYYQYNEYSFNDIHNDMEKYRLPRPSSKTQKDKN